MKDIVIYGGGGLGREIACLIHKINTTNLQWNLVGFVDDGIPVGTKNEYGEIKGGIDYVNNCKSELAVVIAVGTPGTAEKIYNRIQNNRIVFPNIIASSSNIVDNSNYSIGIGNIISYHCGFSCNVHIGNFNVFNSSDYLGHDVAIGNFNSFMPGVRISGEVVIGNNNFFGVNAVVLQKLKIGHHTTIGAGSVLMRSTKDDTTYIGNPAMKFKY